MDKFYVSAVCFLALFACCVFGEDPLQVRFLNDTKVDVSVGAEGIDFRCHLNRGPMFVINNIVQMVKVDPITSNETVLSASGNLNSKPEFYSVKIEEDPENTRAMVVHFNIKKVRLLDDGKFLCRVKSDDHTISAEREVVVHKPLETLKLKFGDMKAVSKEVNDPIEIDPGKYTVACIAEGSNPGTEDVVLTVDAKIDDAVLSKSKPVVEAMATPDRRFRTTVTAQLDIMVQNYGDITCQARDTSGTSLVTKQTISVNTYDPIVSCNDTEAYPGQANPTLVCTVNHTGIDVTGYSFQVGESGEIIKEGVDHAKNFKVTVEEESEDVAIVTLDLHKGHEAYLDRHYYLLIDIVGGHTSKESVRLDKANGAGIGPGGSADRVSSMAASLVASVMLCVAWRWL